MSKSEREFTTSYLAKLVSIHCEKDSEGDAGLIIFEFEFINGPHKGKLLNKACVAVLSGNSNLERMILALNGGKSIPDGFDILTLEGNICKVEFTAGRFLPADNFETFKAYNEFHKAEASKSK